MTPEEEIEGLDVLDHGAPGYADDTATGPNTPVGVG